MRYTWKASCLKKPATGQSYKNLRHQQKSDNFWVLWNLWGYNMMVIWCFLNSGYCISKSSDRSSDEWRNKHINIQGYIYTSLSVRTLGTIARFLPLWPRPIQHHVFLWAKPYPSSLFSAAHWHSTFQKTKLYDSNPAFTSNELLNPACSAGQFWNGLCGKKRTLNRWPPGRQNLRQSVSKRLSCSSYQSIAFRRARVRKKSQRQCEI